MYRGVLEDGHAVAVKRMARASSDEQKEKDFLTELGTVGHVRHPNVSPLIGCCIERGFHLIFEFASNGSVSSNLHGIEYSFDALEFLLIRNISFVDKCNDLL